MKRTVRIKIPILKSEFEVRGGACDILGVEVFYAGRFPWVAGVEIQSVLDGGANIGDSTLFMNMAYRPKVMVAVEPDAANFKQLERNTVAHPGIHRVRGALWRETGTVYLSGPSDSTVSSSVREASDVGESVLAQTIASLAKEQGLEGFDLVKLDVEGAERELLQGEAGEWVRHCRILILELHDHIAPGAAEAMIAALNRWGPFRLLPWGEYLVFVRSTVAGDFRVYGTL